MKKLVILVFVLLGTVTIANTFPVEKNLCLEETPRQIEITITVEWPTGVEEFTVMGYAENIPRSGFEIEHQSEMFGNPCSIPIHIAGGWPPNDYSADGWWFGSCGGTIGSSGLFEDLMAMLEAMP